MPFTIRKDWFMKRMWLLYDRLFVRMILMGMNNISVINWVLRRWFIFGFLDDWPTGKHDGKIFLIYINKWLREPVILRRLLRANCNTRMSLPDNMLYNLVTITQGLCNASTSQKMIIIYWLNGSGGLVISISKYSIFARKPASSGFEILYLANNGTYR